MTRLFEDIYYYKHPQGANCNVYAFLDGRDIDLIDTGIKKLGIVRNLLKQMRRDGLNPARIRKIVHPHYHFDHVQSDAFFQQKIVPKEKKVPVLVPENDLFRTESDFNLLQWNFRELIETFGAKSFKTHFRGYARAFRLGNALFLPLIDVEQPNNIQTFSDGDKIALGKREAVVYSTGGHTEGHALLHFDDEDNILYTGDHDALNEFTCDWGKTLEAVRIAKSLKPDKVFIGHNSPKLETESAQSWLESYFTQFEQIFAPVLNRFEKGQEIKLSNIIRKMMGWVSKMKGLDLWANMSVFSIGKHLQELGLGTLELNSDSSSRMGYNQFQFTFEIELGADDVDLISLIKNGE